MMAANLGESSHGAGSTFHFTINFQAEKQPAPFALATSIQTR